MSQFLKQNICYPKKITENRFLLLTEKINSLKIGQNADQDHKTDNLDNKTRVMENQLENMILEFNDKYLELKHIFGKINKELSFDYASSNREIQEETQHCEEMAFRFIDKHNEERKSSDYRISLFIDQKCAIIRDLIEKEEKERINCIKQVEDSLQSDLCQIREKAHSDCQDRSDRIEQIHQQFLAEYEKMFQQFTDLSQKYAQSQAQFYKMLRDILKKVKSQIGLGKQQRQNMEESILILIEKLCDKAMEDVVCK